LKNRAKTVIRNGFTLLEVLVALFILTIIISLVYGSFQGVFSNADHIQVVGELYEMGTNCLNRITADLESIHILTYPRYAQPDIDDEPDIFRVVGTLESIDATTFSQLRFTTMAHLQLNQSPYSGIAQVVYYIQEDEIRGNVLRRADHLFPYPEFEPQENDPVLCENVQAFELKYFSSDGDEKEEWDSDSDNVNYSTPVSIAIRLAIGDAESPYEFRTAVALPVVRLEKEGDNK
jgi:general secretion pathway protein J